jgi:membrane AbrB-like protein
MSTKPTHRAEPASAFNLKQLLLAVLIGSLGGMVFAYLRLPLPWMLGAMTFTTIASLAGLQMQVPRHVRMPMSAVIGVMLGAAFTPDLIDRLATWSVTIFGLLIYVLVACTLVMVYLRKVARYDLQTAYFSSSPGGLSEMALVGAEMGADVRVVGLSHALRILMVVMALPFLFQLFGDYVPQEAMLPSGSSLSMPLNDWLILGGCALIGAPLAKIARIPAPFLVGPVILSGIAHVAGVTNHGPPGFLIAAAQVIIGGSVGCRFVGVAVKEVLETMVIASGSTAILLLTAVSGGMILQQVTDIPWHVLVLAFAPGGLAEMSLVALAIGSDVAFVATHHICRIAMVVILAPSAFRLFNRIWIAPQNPKT